MSKRYIGRCSNRADRCNKMCSVGGPIDIDLAEGIKGKKYRCNDCGEIFTGLGKHPVCPSCQSDNVTAIA